MCSTSVLSVLYWRVSKFESFEFEFIPWVFNKKSRSKLKFSHQEFWKLKGQQKFSSGLYGRPFVHLFIRPYFHISKFWLCCPSDLFLISKGKKNMQEITQYNIYYRLYSKVPTQKFGLRSSGSEIRVRNCQSKCVLHKTDLLSTT